MWFARRFGVGQTSFLLSLLCLSIPATVTPAGATTLRRMDLPEMVLAADRIVHARAVGNRVRWNETGSQILTDTEFEVLDDAKGTGPKKLTISQLGGRIDPIEMIVEGTPAFAVGEEVVLFTEPQAGESRQIVGLSQGVARVRTDPVTGDAIAVSEVPGGASFVGGNPRRGAPPLETLLEQVRQLAAGGRHGPSRPKAPATDLLEPDEGRP